MDTEEIVERAVAYAVAHGVVMAAPADYHIPPGGGEWKASNMSGALMVHAPFTLYPSPVRSSVYNFARDLTSPLNVLVHKISRDHAFLVESGFTGKLMDVFKKTVLDNGGVENAVCELGINRYDYFVTEDDPPRLLQVEMNTIAASFGCLSARATALHSFTQKLQGADKKLPENQTIAGLSGAIATAHEQFVEAFPDLKSMAKVIMIVQPGERNVYDQQALAENLLETHSIDVVRMSLADVFAFASVDETNALQVAMKSEAGTSRTFVGSVVYFRAGYTPTDYPSEGCWQARELLERSTAAKCPSVSYQLVGTKKVQQVLDADGMVERFLGPEDGAFVRKCFARQWSMSGKEGEEAAAMAIEKPEDFVLKPQREGGGNNFYSEEMATELKRMDETERSAYVLMERIRPVANEALLVRNGEYLSGPSVFELGMFGIFINTERNEEPPSNRFVGHLMRTKLAAVDDGGVAAGVAVLDTPDLQE